MSDVYVIEEDVRYEGSRVKDVCATREVAHNRTQELASKHRYEGDWDESQDDGTYALRNRDVTFIAKRWTLNDE